MAYDDDLADLLRALTSDVAGVNERKMFGGLAFLVHGNMAIAASGEGGLMVRCAPDDTERWLAEPHAAPMVMRGREMRGWIRVTAEGSDTEEQVRPWAEIGVAYARSLPPK